MTRCSETYQDVYSSLEAQKSAAIANKAVRSSRSEFASRFPWGILELASASMTIGFQIAESPMFVPQEWKDHIQVFVGLSENSRSGIRKHCAKQIYTGTFLRNTGCLILTRTLHI
jgi:hypothetical protein